MILVLLFSAVAYIGAFTTPMIHNTHTKFHQPKFYYDTPSAKLLQMSTVPDDEDDIFYTKIDIVDQFTQAWISGDTETLKSLTAEGFKMGSSMNNNPNYQEGDINNLLGQSTWMSNNFVNISVKNRGQAYSDAIEYKRSGLFVQTFQEFIAWDKNNGFKIRTPFNATFVFDKKGEMLRAISRNASCDSGNCRRNI